MSLEPGMLVANNVRLVRRLAEGGMGEVWIAEHTGLSTQVAVKFMSVAAGQNEIAVKRFSQEATAAARIRSPHVVQVFDHGVTPDGVPYIVMELLDGEDLAKRVSRLGPMSVADTLKVIVQACRALSKAHGLGIVHRDIKPENIFVTESDGEMFIKVLDFGIAKRVSEIAQGVTSTGVIVGTPSYMSPEQLLSAKHIDLRSDVWSLGVVAYHCLTSKVPFQGETFGSLAVAIDRAVFPSPSSYRRDLPPAVDGWFAKAMARDPNGRFTSAKEMSEALAAAMGPGQDRSSAPHMTERGHFASDPGARTSVASWGGAVSTPDPRQSGAAFQPYQSGAAPVIAPLPQPTFGGAAVTHDPPQKKGLLAAVAIGAVLLIGSFGVVAFLFGGKRTAQPVAAASVEVVPAGPAAPPPAVASSAPEVTVAPAPVTPASAEPAGSPVRPGRLGVAAPPVRPGAKPSAAPTVAVVAPPPSAQPAAPPPPPPRPPPPPPSGPKVPDRGF